MTVGRVGFRHFERALERGGFDLGELAPGIPEGRIEALAAELGLRLPLVAQQWWGWHNGIAPLLPHWCTLTFDGALWRYLSQQEEAESMLRLLPDGADSRDDWWPPTWFPLCDADGGALLAIDTADEECPVHRHTWDPDIGAPLFASLPLLLDRWTEVLEAGAAWFADGEWHTDAAIAREFG